eukprot:XP_797096.4 PREDICTED: PMS1 protein homolog 1 [Strongylocentrotus purpuratus]
MHKLSGETVRLISSAQVITSVASVVKELLENSLDAHADNVEIKLENCGIDKVEVRDNGDGIQADDADFMGRRHYTSKLSNHDDLEDLITYGFRGEALGSLCAVSNVTIATKTKDEEVGRCYTLDHEGIASSPKPSQCCTGTTVTASRLFHNIPVRKQYYSNAKRRRDELKKVEDLLLSFGVVCPGVRFSLSHNKASIWQKNKVPNIRAALLNMLGSNVMSQLIRVERNDEETQVKIEGFLPKPGSDDQLTTRSTDDHTWIAVNGRPVIMKDISKVVKQYYSQAHPKAGNVRHVIMCLAVSMPTHLVDVNLEPNKTKVLLQNNDAVICLIIQMLEELYKATPPVEPTLPGQSQNQPLSGASAQTATGATCDVDLKQAGQESTLASRDISEGMDRAAPTAFNDSEGISMICDILENSDASMIDGPSQNLMHSKGIDDSHMKPQLNNISIFEEEGEKMFVNCLQSTQSIPPESSRAQISFVDVPDRSETNVNCGRSQGDDTGGEILKEDHVAISNQESLDVGAGNGDDALWSKGQSLTEPSGKIVQPSVLLIPGRQEPAVSESRKATTSTESSFQAPLPCLIRLLQEPINSSITNTRVPQASGTSRLFTTSVTSAENQNTSALYSRGQTSPSRSPGKVIDKTGTSSSVEASSCDSPGRMKRPIEERSSPGTQYDLVGKAPVMRPQDAFAFFFKEKKPEILRQHPTLDFMSINKILQRQWAELNEEEMITYEEQEARDLQRYKDQVVCAKQSLPTKDPKTGLPAKKKKKVEKLSNQSLIDEMLASQRERKQQEKVAEEEEQRLETKIPFSVGKLREAALQFQERSNMDEWRLVGCLPGHGIWTAIKGRQLSVFNQYKAQEVVLYHRLLSTHKLPYQKLPVPIELSAGMFGDQKNWYTLLGRKSQVNPVDQSRLFIDERLLLNPDTMDARLEVVSMSMKIVPFYGLDDLIEIVETIAMQRNGAELVAGQLECIAVPLKTSNHLMGEAVRMARSLPNIMSSEEVSDIIDSVDSLTMWKSKLCLHGKSFIKDIFTIPDVEPD